RKDPFDRAAAAGHVVVTCENALADWPQNENSWYRNHLAEAVRSCRQTESAGAFDLDEAEAELGSLVRRLRDASSFRGSSLERDLREYTLKLEADLAADLREELWGCVELYTREKAQTGAVDFTDLLVKARGLLQHKDARTDLRARYGRIFVDEFQDTDPLQVAVLRGIAPDDGLFVVGDPKQCIYRFRRADPRLYTTLRAEMQDGGAAFEQLGTSWRSTAAIQEFVNSAFRDQMPDYLKLDGGVAALEGQPAVVALPAPRPYEGNWFRESAVVGCMPGAVAAFIQWLTGPDCTWRLRDGRKIKPGDVCILFRRATNSGRDLTEDYVRALESRGIAHVLVGSRGLHSREEIAVLRTALRAIEWPDDELSVYATLRGPLFGIPDNTLFRARESGWKLRPGWTAPDDANADFDRVRAALDILASLRRMRNSRPVAETIRCLLESVRGHVIFAFHRGGIRKLGNIHRLAELARQGDARSRQSFRKFVEWLNSEAEAGEAAEAPVVEARSDGVSLMTAHKAKGLQFPVVILADPTAGLVSRTGCARWVHSDPQRSLCAQRLLGCAPAELVEHEDEENAAEREEGARVAYVAATRAEDLLVVCAVGDQEYARGWLSPLYDSLYPPKDARRKSQASPGCPEFGHNTVLNAPPHADSPQVRPGLHKPRAGSHSVLWFDPALLDDAGYTHGGAEREALLDGDAAPGLERYRKWQQFRQACIEAGSTPSEQAQLATEARDLPEARDIPVEVMEWPSTAPRSSGRLFGRLLHGILEHGPEAAAGLARRFDLSDEDRVVAERVGREILSGPLFGAEAAHVYREYPLNLRLADGTVVEGRADLVRDEGDRWTVIDYKTGQDRTRAVRQVRLYAYILQQATGKPARGFVLEI
ncbi:MAG TPA: UvrD-helicase domain-containing protein, partial [Bryobacteraceae bacterium]|nr:UvrD-helicase domain-containing protein [Bryobacteraceae bacterium]